MSDASTHLRALFARTDLSAGDMDSSGKSATFKAVSINRRELGRVLI